MRARVLKAAATATVAAFLLASCTDHRSAAPTSSTESAANAGRVAASGDEESLPFGLGAFDDAMLQRDIEQLASWGIETYESAGDDEPMVAADQPVSSYRLLLTQVQQLGAEAASGGGTTGSDLDAVFSSSLGIDLKMSALLAGYLQSDAPAATELAKALPYIDLTDPAQAVFPDVVMVALVRDTADMRTKGADASLAAYTGRGSGGSAQVAQAAAMVVAPAAKQAVNVCTLAGNFFEDALNRLFNGLRISQVDPQSFPRWLRWLAYPVNAIITVLDALRSAAQFVFVNGVRILLEPVRTVIAQVASIVSLVVAISGVIKPLTPKLALETPGPEYGIDGQESKTYTEKLTVTTVGPTEWPKEIVPCAELAGVTLPDLSLKDSPVTWEVVSAVPGAVIEKSKDPLLIDESGAGVARYRFTTPTEPQEWHDNGPSLGIQVQVRATVERKTKEIRDAIMQSMQVLLKKLPQFLASRASEYLSGKIDALIKEIVSIAKVQATDTFGILHHGPPETTAPAETSGGPATPGPVWVHVERPRLPGALAGRILELVSCTGPYGTWSGKLRTGGLRANDGFTVPWADLPIKTFTVGGGATRTVRTSADGIVVIPFPVPRRAPLHYNLAVTVNGKTMSIAGVPLEASVSFQNIPIQPAPAGMC